jgi:hypothetical protein
MLRVCVKGPAFHLASRCSPSTENACVEILTSTTSFSIRFSSALERCKRAFMRDETNRNSLRHADEA